MSLVGGYEVDLKAKTGRGQPLISNCGDKPKTQSESLNDNQVPNDAGGYVFKLDDIKRLLRFLILGSEAGIYYPGDKDLAVENCKAILRLIQNGQGEEAVEQIKIVSVEGRAAKQDPTLLALALCARSNDIPTKKAAYAALPHICRIPTHLFYFIDLCEKLSEGTNSTGWGRAHRRAITQWYNQFTPNPGKLAMHVTKYRNRNGWTHRDVLRLAHPKPNSAEVSVVLRYIMKGLGQAQSDFANDMVSEEIRQTLNFLEGVEQARQLTGTQVQEIVQLIEHHKLVREHVPTELLTSVEVWRALLQNMPMMAMIRNLGKMTAINLLQDGSDEERMVCERLNNGEQLKAARVHPFSILLAYHTYKDPTPASVSSDKGRKGHLTWIPNRNVLSALDSAFYKAFKYVAPTNKRICIGLDVSGSMGSYKVNGSPQLSARVASAALMMTTVKTESNYSILAFSHEFKDITESINPSMTLDEVISTVSRIPFGATDCALPMIWAANQPENKVFDVFIVYTDCETYCGAIHPSKALQEYRITANVPHARLIVAGMTSNGFTLADPEDPGMLDMVGFDSAGPEVMRNFMMGYF